MAMVAIAAIGLGISAAGLYMNYQGQKAALAAQQQALDFQKKIEAERQKQLNLDALRRKREAIRMQVAASAQANATATAQGAAYSSALPGALGGISSRTGVNILGIQQNQDIGNTIFGLNEGLLGSYRAAAEGQSTAALGAGLTSLGGAIMRSNKEIGAIGTYVGSKIGF